MVEKVIVNRRWITIAALFGASAVLFGAFGSHGLRDHVSPSALATWRTAVEYHLFHSLALLSVALGARDPNRWRWTMRLWTLGVLLFAGSLYALALSGLRALGAITPLGGICLVAGWLRMAWDARRSQ